MSGILLNARWFNSARKLHKDEAGEWEGKSLAIQVPVLLPYTTLSKDTQPLSPVKNIQVCKVLPV